MGGHQHRSAVAATKQAFQRASLLAEAGGGARLWCEGNMLLAEASNEDLPTMRVSLPADWRVEADDFSLSYDGLTAFDTTGCAANGQYAIIDPQGNRTRVDFLGLTGQIIVYQGVDQW